MRYLRNMGSEVLPLEGIVLRPGEVVAVEAEGRAEAMLKHEWIEEAEGPEEYRPLKPTKRPRITVVEDTPGDVESVEGKIDVKEE